MSKKNWNHITQEKFCDVRETINNIEDPAINDYKQYFLSIVRDIENMKNQKNVVAAIMMYCGIMLTSFELEMVISSLNQLCSYIKLKELTDNLKSGKLSISESIETMLNIEALKKEKK